MRLPQNRWSKLVLTVALLVSLYVGLFAVLSAMGGYHISQTGRVRYGFGLAASDVAIWQPVGARWEPFRNIRGIDTSRGNFLGYLYSPLIRLDRMFFHPTQELMEP